MSDEVPFHRRFFIESREVLESSDIKSTESFKEMISSVHSLFSETKDIFSEDGVSMDDLDLSMGFISLAYHHDIKKYQWNGHSVIYFCGRLDHPPAITPPRKANTHFWDDIDVLETGVLEHSRRIVRREEAAQGQLSTAQGGCHFFFHFRKRTKMGRHCWVLKEDERNCVFFTKGKPCPRNESSYK